MRESCSLVVIFGGDSAERDVSIITGVLCANLLKAKYAVIPVFMDIDGRLYTSGNMFSTEAFRDIKTSSFTSVSLICGGLYSIKGEKNKKIKLISKIDCILNCCHGGLSEGGGVAAIASLQNIPLASPDMYSSAMAMDKVIAKNVAAACGIPVADGFCAEAGCGADETLCRAEKLGFPLVVKPPRAGSSIGVSLAEDGEELSSALKRAFLLDGRALVERYIADKTEISCAVYEGRKGIEVSPAAVTYSGEGIYGFNQKYSSAGGERQSPPSDAERLAREYSAKIYKAFSFFGMVRIDFIFGGGTLYLCEVNAVPGSLCYGLFTRRFSIQRAILEEIVSLSMARADRTDGKKIISDIINKNEIVLSTGCKIPR